MDTTFVNLSESDRRIHEPGACVERVAFLSRQARELIEIQAELV